MIILKLILLTKKCYTRPQVVSRMRISFIDIFLSFFQHFEDKFHIFNMIAVPDDKF